MAFHSIVRIAKSDDILNPDMVTYINILIQTYVKEARDINTTPEETWKLIRDSVLQGDLQSILILYVPENEPKGFMYCRMDDETDTAVIHCGYSAIGTPKKIIDESLEIYEKWARFMGAKNGMFYTFRIAGAHRLMLSKGWRHVITSYKKELK